MALRGCPCRVLGPPPPALSRRYVYDHIGGEHSAVIPELVASVATFAVTTLWLGPCDIVYLWSVLNCFGLNFELWVQKLAEWGPLARTEVSPGGGAPLSSEGVQTHAAPSPQLSPPPSWLSGGWLTPGVPGPPYLLWGVGHPGLAT